MVIFSVSAFLKVHISLLKHFLQFFILKIAEVYVNSDPFEFLRIHTNDLFNRF